MRLPAGFEAVFWLLFLIGCSARPVSPPTTTLSHIGEEHSDDFWLAFLNFEEDQPSAQTANDAAHSVPTIGQRQQLEGGTSWNGDRQGQASSSYSGCRPEHRCTGLLHDVVASHAASYYASVQRHGSASYDSSIADHSGVDQHTSAQPRVAPHSNEPQGAEQHGYPLVGPPTLEYRVHPDQAFVENPVSYVQPSSPARLQQPAVWHGFGYEQGPPDQQPTGHAGSTQPYNPWQHFERVLELQKARDALPDLLDRERAEDLFKIRIRKELRKKDNKPSSFHASKEVKAEFGELLRQKLKVLFPNERGEVKEVTTASPESSIYRNLQAQTKELESFRVEGSEHVYEVSPGYPYVGQVQNGYRLDTDFWAGRWLVRLHVLKPSKSTPKTPGQVRIRAAAILSNPDAHRFVKGQPTRLLIGDFEVPRYAVLWTASESDLDLVPETSGGPSGALSGLQKAKRGRPRRKGVGTSDGLDTGGAQR